VVVVVVVVVMVMMMMMMIVTWQWYELMFTLFDPKCAVGTNFAVLFQCT